MDKDKYFDLLKGAVEGTRPENLFENLLGECRESAKEEAGGEKVNETVLVVDNPDPKLVELLKSGADGGEGEFDEFLPLELEKEVKARDATYVPSLMRDDRVVWSEVSLGSPKEPKVTEEIGIGSKITATRQAELYPDLDKEVPEDSNWREEAERRDLSMRELDRFAKAMGFDNWYDLDISISPANLRDRDPDKFEEELKKVVVEESKVNEQDPEEDPETARPEKPRSKLKKMRLEEPDSDAVPEPPDEVKDPERPMEMRKEYLGKSEDVHFYFITTADDGGIVNDFLITDQEGVKKYSAKAENIEVVEENIADFLIQSIRDVQIAQIERSIFMKYIYPKLTEQVPEDEVIEEPEEDGKKKPLRPGLEAEDEELPRESKKITDSVDEKKLELGDATTLLDFAAWKLFKKTGEECTPEEYKEVKDFILPYIGYREAHPEFGVDEKKKPPVCKKCNKAHWPFKKCDESKLNETDVVALYREYRKENEPHQAIYKVANELDFDPQDVLDRLRLGHAIHPNIKTLQDVKSKLMPESEDFKESNLIEMKVTDDEGNEFDVLLVHDEGGDAPEDVVDISIAGRPFSFSSEFVSMWRDDEGVLSEEGLRELALDALANLTKDEHSELVAKGAEQEAPDEEEDPDGNELSVASLEKETLKDEEELPREEKTTDDVDMSKGDIHKPLKYRPKKKVAPEEVAPEITASENDGEYSNPFERSESLITENGLKVGDKVVHLPDAPPSYQFSGVGRIIDIKPSDQGLVLHVKDKSGSIVQTQDDFVKKNESKEVVEGHEEIEQELDVLDQMSMGELRDAVGEEADKLPEKDDLIDAVMHRKFGDKYVTWVKRQVGLEKKNNESEKDMDEKKSNKEVELISALDKAGYSVFRRFRDKRKEGYRVKLALGRKGEELSGKGGQLYKSEWLDSSKNKKKLEQLVTSAISNATVQYWDSLTGVKAEITWTENVENENIERENDMVEKRTASSLLRRAEKLEKDAKKLRQEAKEWKEEEKAAEKEAKAKKNEGINPKSTDSEEKKKKKLAEEEILETDVAKGAKALIQLAKDALKNGEYAKAAEYSTKLAEIEAVVPAEAEAEVKKDDKPGKKDVPKADKEPEEHVEEEPDERVDSEMVEERRPARGWTLGTEGPNLYFVTFEVGGKLKGADVWAKSESDAKKVVGKEIEVDKGSPFTVELRRKVDEFKAKKDKKEKEDKVKKAKKDKKDKEVIAKKDKEDKEDKEKKAKADKKAKAKKESKIQIENPIDITEAKGEALLNHLLE